LVFVGGISIFDFLTNAPYYGAFFLQKNNIFKENIDKANGER